MPSRRLTQDVMKSFQTSQVPQSAPQTSNSFHSARGAYYKTLRDALTIYSTHKENAGLSDSDKEDISSLAKPTLTRWQIYELRGKHPSIQLRTLSTRIEDGKAWRRLKSFFSYRDITLAEGARSSRRGKKVSSSSQVMSDAMDMIRTHVSVVKDKEVPRDAVSRGKRYEWREQSQGPSVWPMMPPKEDFDICSKTTRGATASAEGRSAGAKHESRDEMLTRESKQIWNLLRRLEHLQLAWSGVGKKSELVQSRLRAAKNSIDHYKDLCGISGGTIMNVRPTCEESRRIAYKWRSESGERSAKDKLWELANDLTSEFDGWCQANVQTAGVGGKSAELFDEESVKAQNLLSRKAYWDVKELSVDDDVYIASSRSS